MLKHFTTEDWRRFYEFVSSPFFNKRKELIPFCAYLKKVSPEFSEKKLKKETVYQAILPNQPFDEKQLSYLMSYLLTLAEKYLGWIRIEKEELYLKTQTLNSLADLKMENQFRKKYLKTFDLLKKRKDKQDYFFLNHFFISAISAREFGTRKNRTYNKHLEDSSNYLDAFYFLNKIKFACNMIDSQFLIAADYQIQFLDELTQYLLKQESINPKVEIYLQVYKMLTVENPEPYFYSMNKLFNEHFDLLNNAEKKEIYFYAINFCARKIRTGEEKYVDDALHLYDDAIKNDILVENGFLSPWTFTNVSRLALRLQRYDWIEKFIFENKEKLDPIYRENTFAYNLSELYYHKKDYDKALGHLNQVKFSDLQFHLGSRVILIKIYYETNEENSLLALIASFSMFLKRNKNISNNLRKTCQNFCDILNQILRRNPKKKDAIKKKIKETTPLTERNWLSEVLEEEFL